MITLIKNWFKHQICTVEFAVKQDLKKRKNTDIRKYYSCRNK